MLAYIYDHDLGNMAKNLPNHNLGILLHIVRREPFFFGCQVRKKLKEAGYKAGRISQLIRATRPVPTVQSIQSESQFAAGSTAVEQEDATMEVEAAETAEPSAEALQADEEHEENEATIHRILAEAEEDELHSVEWLGQPGILAEEAAQDLPLFRLRGKTKPYGAWQQVQIPPWVKEKLASLEEVTEEGSGPAEVAGRQGVAAVLKRPARQQRPNETCPGRSPEALCIFSVHPDRLGQAASVEGQAECRFCRVGALDEAMAIPHKQKFVTQAFRLWQTKEQHHVFAQALQRMSPEAQAKLQVALARPSRAAAAVQSRAAARAETAKQLEENMLAQRQFFGKPPGPEERAKYRQQVADDQRRLRSKFGPWLTAQTEGDQSWRSEVATSFEQYCRSGAWTMCEQCHRLEKQPLRERHLTGKKPWVTAKKQCQHCKHGIGYPTVQPDDIPEALRDLSDAAIWALRPLEPDVGRPAWAKHGYRVHTDMIRFWWRSVSVEEQLQELETEEDAMAAQTAYEYLMAADTSSYRRFVEMHKKFLRQHRQQVAHAAESEDQAAYRFLQLPRRALEEEGIECALWPHLYPRTNMCETHVRKQDARRQTRRGAEFRGGAVAEASLFFPVTLFGFARRLRAIR